MQKIIQVFCLAALAMVLANCDSSVPSSGVAEKIDGYYDNGKNLLYIPRNSIDGTAIDIFISTLQNWIDSHPDKKIVSITSFDNTEYGRTSGFLVVYEDRNSGVD